MSQYEVKFTAKDANGHSVSQYTTAVTTTVPASSAGQAAAMVRQMYGQNTVIHETRSK